MSVPSPRFTGIFIPVEILEMNEINAFDKMLLSWIDALFCKEHGGCFASNEYLSQRLNVEVNTIVKVLTKLRKLRLIEDVSFDGRRRVIRACIGRHVEESQSKSAWDLNPMQHGMDILPSIGKSSHPGCDNRPTPPYIYSKAYRKEEREGDTPKPPPPSSSKAKKEITPKKAFGEYVCLEEGQYEVLCGELGKDLTDYYIQAINLYMPNSGKRYKDYSATIRSWHLKDIKNNSLPKIQTPTAENLSDDRLQKSAFNKAWCEANLKRFYSRTGPERIRENNASVEFWNDDNERATRVEISFGQEDCLEKVKKEVLRRYDKRDQDKNNREKDSSGCVA